MDLDKLTALWTRIRDSLWFIPTTFTFGAAVLAFITVSLDMQGVLALSPPGEDVSGDTPGALRVIFSGTANGARNVLSVIATGLITVTGVVFSVTIVAIQLASTQFTPRILRNFTADRGNQLVLGVFIATFTYALLVQRVVRAEEDGFGAFVPNLSITVALVLTLVSIGFLIFFIDHAARSVQAAVIIDRVTHDTLRTIRRTLPDEFRGGVDEQDALRAPEGGVATVPSRSSGYVQGVDQDALMELLEAGGRTIRLIPHVGDFVMTDEPLAEVWPGPVDPEGELARTVRGAFVLGYERTPRLDPELGVVELVDIAVKALSPGINDPTTATICLDRLSEIVVEFGRREPPAVVHRHPESGAVLILQRPEFEHMVDTALTQIRHFGADNPTFAESMLRRIAEMGRLLPDERHPPLLRHAEALLREARSHEPPRSDAERLEGVAAQARATLTGAAGAG